ncbi:MAG: MmcQ/YjbR family DNA-binding protein [Erysipelotrichaceae bacterium]|nr:MmcQ/YjbR family DNA-binding protein [Erysipelotrichaceae bacterium]
MKYTWLDEYLMAKPGVEKDFKEEWLWQRYMIDKKMFVALCFDENHKEVFITLKLEPAEGELLREEYEDIIPGYYMNKMHWNSIKADGEVPDELLKDLLDKSYQLILNSFSKKKQLEILFTNNK